ncbi:phosphopyruvate hydratase [Haloglomus litoreum]|uniref:phosphopyruvate hydratase n=1 Tax=Haloglomus litoreum TaxID=3034026 RepID=UPI0023E7FA11|nr:enolase C-terminal domain-like protein [Haloglomus sp. DT116]
MTTIASVDAWEVLDSRGHPTVRVAVETAGGRGVFTVPAGASTGTHEAVERRDGGDRYGSLGVREAVRNVREDLGPLVEGRDVADQQGIDGALVEFDGTETLSNVGGNAVLGVSGAVAHAAADTRDEPLFESLAPDTPGRLPLPMVNIISGGLHAEGGVEIQDFLVVPTGAETFPGALEAVWAVRRAVRDRVAADRLPLVADEGGFALPFDSVEAAFDLLVAGIRDAGFEPAPDEMAIAVDVAASHFHDPDTGEYVLETLDRRLAPDEMVEQVVEWVDTYPVVSVEDPLAEDDWAGWEQLADRIADRVQLLGDDLLVTDAERVRRAADAGAASAVLVKPNQAGTLTRATDVLETATERGLGTVVSARSGETCDVTIADLAVAYDAGQIKIGSLARSERLAKYNRLLELDHRYDPGLARPAALPPFAD